MASLYRIEPIVIAQHVCDNKERQVIADDQYYARRAQQKLDLAAATADLSVKVMHLDMAARYATLGELVSARHHKVGSPDACRDLATETTRLGSTEVWP